MKTKTSRQNLFFTLSSVAFLIYSCINIILDTIEWVPTIFGFIADLVEVLFDRPELFGKTFSTLMEFDILPVLGSYISALLPMLVFAALGLSLLLARNSGLGVLFAAMSAAFYIESIAWIAYYPYYMLEAIIDFDLGLLLGGIFDFAGGLSTIFMAIALFFVALVSLWLCMGKKSNIQQFWLAPVIAQGISLLLGVIGKVYAIAELVFASLFGSLTLLFEGYFEGFFESLLNGIVAFIKAAFEFVVSTSGDVIIAAAIVLFAFACIALVQAKPTPAKRVSAATPKASEAKPVAPVSTEISAKTAEPTPEKQTEAPSNLSKEAAEVREELVYQMKLYKGLLDEGTITVEEYNKKKDMLTKLWNKFQFGDIDSI